MSLVNPLIAAQLAEASWIRKMFEEGNRLRAEFGADQVFDFSLGNPHLEPPPAWLDRLQAVTADPRPGLHCYMPNPGYPETRAHIADYLSAQEGISVPASHILMTTGAAAALNIALRALVAGGEAVVVFAPYFPEYRFYALHSNATCRVVDTDANFDLNLDLLEASLTPEIRVVILNSPNNPTGKVYSETAIVELCHLLKQKSQTLGRPIILLSDEPYRRLVFDGIQVPTLFQHYPYTLLATSFSKDLGLAGERIGFLAVHPDFPDALDVLSALIFCLRTMGFVNAPALMQRSLVGSLDAVVEVARYQENRDRLYEGLTKIGYECVLPQGAFFLFPRTPVSDDLAFVNLLTRERILAVPGRGFGRPGHIRLSYAIPSATIPASLPGFARAFEQAQTLAAQAN